ncbi:MAG: hypothetical protein Ct9H300mP19_20620 [Dehalococcoidia bacterium]|nr:MAG: hypothetical protein Ct9H300mP19_20620 [Dehalococcoidia bacterium]
MLNIWMQENFKADPSDPTVIGNWFSLENWPLREQSSIHFGSAVTNLTSIRPKRLDYK